MENTASKAKIKYINKYMEISIKKLKHLTPGICINQQPINTFLSDFDLESDRLSNLKSKLICQLFLI